MTLHFDGEMSVPSAPYDGGSHQIETISETTVQVTVEMTEIEDQGQTLISFAELDSDEMRRLGLNPDAFGDGNGPGATVEISASREVGDITAEEREKRRL